MKTMSVTFCAGVIALLLLFATSNTAFAYDYSDCEGLKRDITLLDRLIVQNSNNRDAREAYEATKRTFEKMRDALCTDGGSNGRTRVCRPLPRGDVSCTDGGSNGHAKTEQDVRSKTQSGGDRLEQAIAGGQLPPTGPISREACVQAGGELSTGGEPAEVICIFGPDISRELED